MPELPENVDVERPASGVAVVAFTGEHDLTTRRATSALLASLIEDNGAVIVDFSKAKFVDTSIMEVVQEANRTARDRGTIFRLQLGTAPIVDMLFRITGVSTEVECASTRAEALAGTGERNSIEQE